MSGKICYLPGCDAGSISSSAKPKYSKGLDLASEREKMVLKSSKHQDHVRGFFLYSPGALVNTKQLWTPRGGAGGVQGLLWVPCPGPDAT